MLSLEDIQMAQAKVKSGANFPAYIQDLIKLGVRGYQTFVSDGQELYFADDGTQLQSPSKYEVLPVAESSNSMLFKQYLKNHQQGQSDYPTFCRQAAETGVEKWVVDTDQMICTYYDKAGGEILMEKIGAPPKPL